MPLVVAGAYTMVPSSPQLAPPLGSAVRGERLSGTAVHRDLLQLFLCEEADPLSVGRKERVEGAFGAGERRRRERGERPHVEPRDAFADRDVRNRPAVGRQRKVVGALVQRVGRRQGHLHVRWETLRRPAARPSTSRRAARRSRRAPSRPPRPSTRRTPAVRARRIGGASPRCRVLRSSRRSRAVRWTRPRAGGADPFEGSGGATSRSPAASCSGSAVQSGSARTTAARTSVASSPGKVCFPVSISNSTTPNAQMSARRSAGRPLRLLGRHVRCRAEDHARGRHRAGEVSVGELASATLPVRPAGPPACLRQRLRQAEVEHLHRAVRPDLDVGRLEVPVDDAEVVCRLERLGDLPGDRRGLGQRDGTQGDAVGERRRPRPVP